MEDSIALIGTPPVPAGVMTEVDTITPRVREEKPESQWKQHVISAAICLPLLIFYVASSETTYALNLRYNKPFAIAWTASFFYWIGLPLYVLCKYIQHWWLNRPFDAFGLFKRRTLNFPLYCMEVMILSFLWLFELYFFSAALLKLPPSSVLLLWQGLSAALILALSVALLGVRTQLLLRLASLVLSVGGVAFITLSSKEGIWSTTAVLGVLFTLFSVVGYSVYATAFKIFTDRHALKQGEPDIALMVLLLAGMGVAMIVYAPIFVLLHFGRVEVFSFPSYDEVALFFANNFLVVGTNFSFALCVGIISPMFTSIASMLALPLTSVVDYVLHDIGFSIAKGVGTAAICLGFAAMLLAEYLQLSQRRTRQ